MPATPAGSPELRRALQAFFLILALAALHPLLLDTRWLNLPGLFPFLRKFTASRVYYSFPFLFHLVFFWSLRSLVLEARVSRRVVALIFLAQLGHDVYRTDYALGWKEGLPTYRQWVSASAFDRAERITGRGRGSYAIACLGLFPAVAHLNGFRTVDGFWNLYPLAYKHRFRKVIAAELERSPELRSWFDGWGNRCYLVSHELGLGEIHYTKDKAAPPVEELSLDVRALAELGASYLFSAVPVRNAAALGLHLIGQVRGLADSSLDLWIYALEPGDLPPAPR